MDFINHTNNWIKGEIFEGTAITVFALIALVSSFLFWKLGSTAHAKAITIPTLVVGLLLLAIGLSMYFSNQKRLVDFKTQYEENAAEFIQTEKKRVEDFQYMYVVSKIIASASFAFAIYAFWFSKSPTFQGIAIAFLVVGLGGLIIDFFSEERASIYYSAILNQIQ